MPLPKITTPTYELELPSTGKTVKYRPFLVKEEKVLVIALESEDNKQITNAIKAVLKACVQTKGVRVELFLRLILNICSLISEVSLLGKILMLILFVLMIR